MNKSCCHEAAHAVVSWYMGQKLVDVSVSIGNFDDDLLTPFYCRTEMGLSEFKKTSDQVRGYVASYLASHFIEMKISNRPSYGAMHDILDAMNFLTFNSRKSPEVISLIEAAWKAFNGNPEDDQAAALQFYEGAGFEEFYSDPDLVNAIDTLAGRLEKRGKMTGREVARFLEEAWTGPRPEKALSAKEHGLVEVSTPEDALESAARQFEYGLVFLREHSEVPGFEDLIKQAMALVFMTAERQGRI